MSWEPLGRVGAAAIPPSNFDDSRKVSISGSTQFAFPLPTHSHFNEGASRSFYVVVRTTQEDQSRGQRPGNYNLAEAA